MISHQVNPPCHRMSRIISDSITVDELLLKFGGGITYVIPWVILRDCSSHHHLLHHTHGPGKDHVVFFVPPTTPFASYYRHCILASHGYLLFGVCYLVGVI